ncbi:MAG: hypothetical protein KME57_33690, partial [Scytonema hyalinum WJT4-NPBG1]|nr:hypothetical protein [Scytonema hyalinum WJT4-NPBG1]
ENCSLFVTSIVSQSIAKMVTRTVFTQCPLLSSKTLFRGVAIADIEAYQPDDSVAKEREQWRAEYIARVLRVLQTQS